MSQTKSGLSELDKAIATEVRSEMARNLKKSYGELADLLGMSRGALSARTGGRIAFTAGDLSIAAKYLGTTASALTRRAELVIARGSQAA